MNDKLLKLGAIGLLPLALATPSAHGQLRQNSPPGTLIELPIPVEEEIEDRLANAPWDWGSVRVQPRFSIGNLVYNANVFDSGDPDSEQDDLRGSISAGIETYLPVGPDVVLTSFVAPSYSWWQKNEQLRRFNMNYGAGVFGFFNRLETQLTASRNEFEEPLNSEAKTPVTTRQDSIRFDGSVTLHGPWQLFGSLAYVETRYPESEALTAQVPNLFRLERDENVSSMGVAYDVPGRFNLGIGWRRVESDFLDADQARSNSGNYPIARIRLPGNRVQLNAEIGFRLLEFEDGAGLQETEEAIGTLQLTVPLATRTALTFYSGRDIVYSAIDESSYFTGGRSGVGLGWGSPQSVRFSIFAEAGKDDYESAGGVNLDRVDEGESYGVALTLPLRWGLEALFGATETTIDSNFDEFDRSTTELLGTVRLSIQGFSY